MFFIQVVRGRPGGRLQFYGEGSKMAWLASGYLGLRIPVGILGNFPKIAVNVRVINYMPNIA